MYFPHEELQFSFNFFSSGLEGNSKKNMKMKRMRLSFYVIEEPNYNKNTDFF